MELERHIMSRHYEVTVEREGRWWVFDIPELGTGGQARNLAEVSYEAQGVAAMWLDVPPETVTVNVTVKGHDVVLAEWTAAEHDEDEARQAQARAAERRRAVVHTLRAEGYTAADAGRVLGISKQRVHQIEVAARNRAMTR
jgi:DNA-directed RNA polymerase specialized sigma24 family protein